MVKDKKNEEQATLSISKVTEENIVDQIKNANKFSQEIVEMSNKNDDEEAKKRQARELSQIKAKATYINLKSVLRTRRDRAAEKATSAMRTKSKELLDKVIAGELTGNDYDEEIRKALKESIDAVKKANNEYDTMCSELRNQFPSAWSYDWDDPYRQIQKAMR